MKTDPLLCLKINSTFHIPTLAHNIKLLMIQQLPSQPQGLTHNKELVKPQFANSHHSLTCLPVPSINTTLLYVTN
jgi:hypothetical protein